jgi:hypothetical protein
MENEATEPTMEIKLKGAISKWPNTVKRIGGAKKLERFKRLMYK